MPKKDISESKEQRFKRVVSKRTQKVLNNLRVLGNCSNKGIYKYNRDEVHKVFSVIDKELRRVKALFHTGTQNNNFTL